MSLVVVTPPTDPLLTPADVRAQLGLGEDVADAKLAALIAAATGVLDGPDGWLGRALRIWQLELRLDRFPIGEAPIDLACPPILSADSIIYLDVSGAEEMLDAALWQFDGERSLYPAYGHDWPVGRAAPNAVRVQYTCGYYESAAVPASILQAIVLQVAALLAMMRADPSLTSDTVVGVSSQSWSAADIGEIYDKAALRLLAPYRVFQ